MTGYLAAFSRMYPAQETSRRFLETYNPGPEYARKVRYVDAANRTPPTN